MITAVFTQVGFGLKLLGHGMWRVFCGELRRVQGLFMELGVTPQDW